MQRNQIFTDRLAVLVSGIFDPREAIELIAHGADPQIEVEGIPFFELVMQTNEKGELDKLIEVLVERLFGIPPSCHVDSMQLKIGAKIGSGTYGTIFCAKFNQDPDPDPDPVVIKKIIFQDEAKYGYDLLKYFNEVKHMYALTAAKVSNVVKFIGYDVPTAEFSHNIIMEHVSRNSLAFILSKSPEDLSDWGRRYVMMQGAAAGLSGIHACRIIHRDIKSANILVTHDWEVKIADFGLAKNVSMGYAGSLYYMAPELLDRSASNSEASDVYSLSMVFAELAVLKILEKIFTITGNNIKEYYKSLHQYLLTGSRVTLPADCPRKIAALVKWGWGTDLTTRPLSSGLRDELNSDVSVVSERLRSYL